MKMLSGFMSDMMSNDPGKSDQAIDKIMSEFTNFLSESGDNNDIKEALNQVVNEIISKESLYAPMKELKEELPKWLEENWDKIS